MKYLIGFILAALVFLVGFCTGQRLKECPEVKQSIDSVREPLPPVIKETEKPKPIKTYKEPRAKLADNSNYGGSAINKDSKPRHMEDFKCEEINVYSDTLTDSSGTIISRDSIRGELLKKKVKFIPNFLTVTETKVIENPVPQSGLFIGLEAGIGTLYRIAPEIEYMTKNGNAYSYNYDLINNIHSVGYKKRLKF